MATITGTNGNDNLTGTAEADTIRPLGGRDMVDGLGGSDTLIVDYTNSGYIDPYAGATAPNRRHSVVTSSGGSFGGEITEAFGTDSVNFASVEHLQVWLNRFNDVFILDGGALALGATASVNAGDGWDDRIVVQGMGGHASRFQVNELPFGGGFHGNVAVGDNSPALWAYYFESYNFVGSTSDDSFHLSIAPASLSGLGVNFDGGAGTDFLHFDSSRVTSAISFRVVDGVITSSFGSFVSLERFSIQSGSGDDVIQTGDLDDSIVAGAGSNEVRTGAGDDYVYTQTGGDTVDMGAGSNDYFHAHYSDSSLGLTVDMGATITLSNGTTVVGAEFLNLRLGYGDDVFNLTSGSAYVEGGGGYDTFVSTAAPGGPKSFSVYGALDGGLAGHSGQVTFAQFEYVVFKGGDHDDSFQVSGSPAGSFSMDGGGGTDELALSLWLPGASTFIVAPDGTITTNRGTFANFEKFAVSGADGADVFTTQAGDDNLHGQGGDDQLSAGAGNDILQGDVGNDHLDGGAGDDQIYTGPGDDIVIGGSGTDVVYLGYGATLTPTGTGWTAASANGTDSLTGVEIVNSGGWTLLVGSGGFATIQEAVNAAQDYDTILIASGTYVEQVVVSGLDYLRIKAAPGAQVTIQAPADLHETARSSTGREIHAVLTVKDSAYVLVENIDIDGHGAGNSVDEGTGAGLADFYGVFMRNSSATLTNVDVTGARDPYAAGTTPGGHPLLSGAQRGVGVGSDNDSRLYFEMTGGSISDFQTDAGLFRNASLMVRNVTVTGGGAQTAVVQNGFQAIDSSGTIYNNVISAIGYSGPAEIYSGLILLGGNTDVYVGNNRLTGANLESSTAKAVGISISNGHGNGGFIIGNTISNVDTGIDIFGSFSRSIGMANNAVTDIDGTNRTPRGLEFETAIAQGSTAYRFDGTSADDRLSGGNGADRFFGLAGGDILIGQSGDDSLYGGDGDDSLYGGDDGDLLRGGPGVDYFDGGSETPFFSWERGYGDRVSFFEERATQGVVADLRTGIISNDGFGNVETMANIESLGADTAYADTLYGNDSINFLYAGRGDHLYGFGGNDTLQLLAAAAVADGGEGSDWLSILSDQIGYRPDSDGDGIAEDALPMTGGYTVNLAAGTLRDGHGDTGTVAGIENIRGSALGDDLRGDGGDNAILGNEGNDLLRLQDGGDDVVFAGAGSDNIFFIGALTGADIVNGGSGTDTLVLQGPYGSLTLTGNITEIENISLLGGNNTNFGEPGSNRYDYVLTTHDSNFAAGVQARINGAALLEGEDFTFDGSAETDARFVVYGGKGKDTLTGGLGHDIFFYAEERFASGDTVNGGAGYDGMFLRGNYTIDFNAPGYTGLFTNIENLTLTSATDERYARGGTEFDYNLTLSNAIVKPGETLTVSGALLMATETMILDASQESDGFLRLFAGRASDTLKGGANADLIHGNLGADSLTGNGGADTFRYDSTAESNAASRDQILDFTPGTDKIDLSRVDANGTAAGDQAFTWIGSSAFSGSAGQLRAFEQSGTWFLEGDTDGDSVADLVIALTLQGPTPLGASDFLL